MHICPNNAIIMAADEEGFKYPQIDDDKCIDCGLCKKTCPFHVNYFKCNDFETPIVYAVKHVDEKVRLSSSSGGMFSALSDYVLANQGVIFGAGYDEDFRVCHKIAENQKDRDEFKGSKYVQSDVGNIFIDVKRRLEDNRLVLFTGTPCQIAGLKAYLRYQPYDNLILCDLVCHGVPSPLVWADYVKFLKVRFKYELKKFEFRNKTKGWHNSCLLAEFENGSIVYNSHILDCYTSLFYQHNILRPSCYDCVFTNFRRPSDITIGDFWGIDRYKPHFDDDKGVSLVLINSYNGKSLFDKINSQLLFEKSDTNECRQRHLLKPPERPLKREGFWKDYSEHGFEYVAKKYTRYGLFNRVKGELIKPILEGLGIIAFARKLMKWVK